MACYDRSSIFCHVAVGPFAAENGWRHQQQRLCRGAGTGLWTNAAVICRRQEVFVVVGKDAGNTPSLRKVYSCAS